MLHLTRPPRSFVPLWAVPPALCRQAAALAAGWVAAGWGGLYGLLWPFGLGLALGAPGSCAAAVCVGAVAGVLLRHRGAGAVAMLTALGVCALGRRLRPHRFWPACAAGCTALVGAMGLMVLSGAADAVQLLCAAAEALCAAAFGAMLRRWPPEQGGAGLLLPGAVGVVCAANLPTAPFEAGAFAAALACLVLGCRGRLRDAAVASAVLAVGLAAARPALGFGAAALCGGTVAAAVFAPGAKLRCGVVFWLGCLPGAFCAAYPEDAIRFLGAVAAAELAFALVPPQRLLAVPAADPAEGVARPVISHAAGRLSAVAESLSGIAATVDGVYRALPHKGETFNWVVDCTHDELCAHCTRREECWQKGYSNTVDGLFALKPLLEERGRVGVEDLPGQLCRCIHPAALSAAVGRAFALYRGRREARIHAEALRTALTEQYGAVADALAGISAQLQSPGVPDGYKSGRVAALFASLGLEPSECAVTVDGTGRLRAAVTLPRANLTAGQLQQLAQQVGRVCRRPIDPPQKLSCGGMTTLIFREKPVYRVRFGMAALPAAGEVCGDAVQQFCSGTAAQMILCDGMGTGRPAAVDGNLAAELTARLLKAGFEPQTAARLVNVALSLKSDEESGATLDLITVDLYTGAAAIYKAGGVPGLWYSARRDEVHPVGGESLPIGVAGAVTGESLQLRLAAGDWVVLVSDGMLADGPAPLARQIAEAARARRSPQQLAQALVAEARRRAEGRRPDDMTAAVLLLERAEG